MSLIYLTDEQEATIDRWLSAVETGDPDGDYGNVTRLPDGPGGKRQITYGKHQTTEAGRNLQKLIEKYLDRLDTTLTAKGRDKLEDFVAGNTYSRADDVGLVRVLKRAGDDPVMQDVQNQFFLENYMAPARNWAEKNGFTSALAMLVIYDSFIHSGGIPSWLRRRFRAVPPAKGGTDAGWISEYVNVRHQWLKYWGDGRSDKSKALRTSSYRTKALLEEIDRNNWDLGLWPISVNGNLVRGKRKKGVRPAAPEDEPCPLCGK